MKVNIHFSGELPQPLSLYVGHLLIGLMGAVAFAIVVVIGDATKMYLISNILILASIFGLPTFFLSILMCGGKKTSIALTLIVVVPMILSFGILKLFGF